MAISPTDRSARSLASLAAAAMVAGAVGAASCGGGGGSQACTLQPTACATVGAGCQLVPSAAGTSVGDPTPGDCQKLACDGAGHAVSVPDAADLPANSNPCALAQCTAGVPSRPFRPAGTDCGAGLICDGAGACVSGCSLASDCPGSDSACSARTCTGRVCGAALAPYGTDCGGGLVCNGAGLCGCSTAADCPGADTACSTRQCLAQVCTPLHAPPGTVIPDPAPGDCHGLRCDGSGGLIAVVDDADVPGDGNPCTLDVCTAGVPSHPPASASTPCQGGTCDGAGSCPTAPLNGCTRATATDLTGSATVTVTFPVGIALRYSQPCIVVKAGTVVTFTGSFTLHPLTGGQVVGATPTPATSGPFYPATTTGTTAPFAMSAAGTWPYYCGLHGALGMMGVVYVAP